MRDFPVFTTEYGVASLFLREIPYRGRAHIKLQSTQEPDKLLEECIAFCRMCGAEWIDAAGHEYLKKYPLITAIVAMQCDRQVIGQSDACLFPVTEQTLQRWLDIYNERMADIPNAAYMDSRDGRKLLEDGDGYFVHRDGQLLGIGKAKDDFIDTVISVQPGAGQTVVQALCSALQSDRVRLWVASANTRAVRLYERMGFLTVGQISNWYRVL
jgi:ribosomal protein S18 acetylase RimI-like enzyme